MIAKKHHYMETWQRKATGHGGCCMVKNSQHLGCVDEHVVQHDSPGPIRELTPIALEMKRRMDENPANAVVHGPNVRTIYGLTETNTSP